MEIIRDGKTIVLTSEELEAAYREAKADYMLKEVETVIKGVCENTGVVIPEKTKKRLISSTLRLYEYYEGMTDDWRYNCADALRETIPEFSRAIGKRKVNLLVDNCC